MKRRSFLARIGAVLAAGGGMMTTKASPAVQQVIDSPRYILNPETGVWFERIKEGVYRAMSR